MNSLTRSKVGIVVALSVVVLFGLSILPTTAFAQWSEDGGCCDVIDTYSPNYDVYDTYSPNYDVYDTYSPNYDVFDTASPNYDVFDTASPNYDVFDTASPNYYNQECGCYEETVYENGVAYTEQSYSSGGSSGSSYGGGGGSSQSRPFTFSAPSYPSYPAPIYPQPQRPIQQQQQQQQQQQGGGPITIVNTNTNTNVNTNTAPVIPVYQAPITYPVQYIAPQYPTYQRPYCTISISNYGAGNYGTYGNQLATLTWSSSYGTSAYISPNVGTVAPYGSMTVYPSANTVYTMTVYGQGGTATCQTTNYNYAVPSVSLSQIPYTGFDFGILGNSIYWLSLVTFALAGGYLLVYFKGTGALALAGAMIPARARKSEVVASLVGQATPVETTEEIEAPIASPVQVKDIMQHLPVIAESRNTIDTMVLARSKNSNQAPRIVITRA